MKSRKGFTLVELIGVIILIGLIALIAIPSVDYVIKKTEDNAYEATVKTLMDGLRNWTTDNKELVYEDGTEILLTLTDLKEQGYVDFDIRNPKTKLCLANNMQFKITRVKNSEKDTYEYTILDNELIDGTLRDCEAVSKTPSIYLLGDNPQKIEITNDIALGYEAYDPGVVAKSTTGEDLTHSVVKTNDVKLNILSKNYHAKYTIIENGISKTVTRKVHVVDTTAPELHVPEDLEIELGETLNLLEGVTATDNSSETPKIKTSGNVNFNKEGEYKVTYIATDSSGNSVSKDRAIKVTRGSAILEVYPFSGIIPGSFRSDTYRDYIVSMTFTNHDNVPANAKVQWDLSEAKDGSITGWLVESDSNPGYYHMYIGSNKDILANPTQRSWFRDFTSLSKINFGNFDTKLVTDMFQMFSGLNLSELDLSSFDTSNVETMYSMFYNLKVDVLDLNSFNTSSLNNIGQMFCRSEINELIINNFDTSNVTNMYNLFYEASISNVDLSNFDTSNVTSMVAMFYRAEIPTIDVSNFDTSKVTHMGSMFYSTDTSKLDVSSFETRNVTNMSSMFENTKVTTLDVSNFDTSNVTDMSNMFAYTNATILDVSNFDTSQVTNMANMFSNTKSTVLDVSSFDTSNVTNMNSMFKNSEATILDVSNFNTSNVTNMAYMFNHSNSLSLDIKNFNTVKVTNMSYMFYGTELLEIDLSNFNTSNVTNMDSMFYYSSFNSLDLSNFDASQVTNMADMFGVTKNLKTIKTPYNIQLTVDISDITSYDFTGSDGNTYAAGTFPKGNTSSITLTR